MLLFENTPNDIRNIIEETLKKVDDSYAPILYMDLDPILVDIWAQMFISICRNQNCYISQEDSMRLSVCSLTILQTTLVSKVFSAILSMIPCCYIPRTNETRVHKMMAIYSTYKLGDNLFGIIKNEYNKTISIDSSFIKTMVSVQMPNSQTLKDLYALLDKINS